jgi:hypothetical protein
VSMLSCLKPMRTPADTKNHCINNCNDSLYAQQHPTRLGKQLHPQTVGLLVSGALKNIKIGASHHEIF